MEEKQLQVDFGTGLNEPGGLEQNNHGPVNPADPVGEIVHRLTVYAGVLSILAKSKAPELAGDIKARLQASSDYIGDAAAFMRNNQQTVRAIFDEVGADYELITRELNDAIFQAAGGAHKFPPGLTDAQILQEITRRVAKYPKGQPPVKKEPRPVNEPDVLDLLHLNPKAPPLRLDLATVISAPASVAAQAILDVAARAEGGLPKLRDLELKNSTHSAGWDVRPRIDEEYNGRVLITRQNTLTKDEIKLGIKDLSKFEHWRAGVSKKFAKLILTKAGLDLDAGKPATGTISINAAELVGLGMYKRKEDARVGILTAVNSFIDNFGFWMKQQGGKKAKYTWAAFIVVARWDEDGDTLNVVLNPFIPWHEICAQFTYLPTFYFRLSSRAADLIDLIYTLARMNGHDLNGPGGAYYVNLSTVAERLRLPPVAGCKYAKKYIKDPIYNALEEIKQAGGGEVLSLEAPTGAPLNPDLPVNKWIQGRLRIEINNTPAWGPLSEIFEKNRQKAGAAARQKIAVNNALAIDEARAKKKKAATNKKKSAGQNELAAKYAAAVQAAAAKSKEQEGNK